MSGDKNTQNDPAQYSEINALFEPSNSKELCDFDGVKSVSDSCFDSPAERIPVYPNAVVGDEGYVGDITNWDVGRCFDQGLNPVQSVGEVFDDIFDTGFQGSVQPEMGNNFGNNNVDQPDHGNVFLTEQLPACGGENIGCKPVEDGINVTPLNENRPGSSVGAAGTDGDKVSHCSIEMTGGKSLNPTEVENKACGPADVGSWESIYEVAKQSEEIVGRILTECDESETGELLRVFNGVECLKSETETPSLKKPDIVGECLNPGDKVVGLSPPLPFQKEDIDGDRFRNDHVKYNNLKVPSHAGNMVSDLTYLESMTDGVRFDAASKIQEECDKQMEQKENATAEAEQHNACEERTDMAEQAGKSHHEVGKHSGGVVKGTPNTRKKNASRNAKSRQLSQKVGAKAYAVVCGIPATDPTAKAPRFGSPIAYDAAKKSGRGRRSGVASAASSRALQNKSEERSITPVQTANLENIQDSTVKRRGRKKRGTNEKSDDEFSKMRKRLRYLVHRISYEQNLLDAYSSEGWRGQSVEKIRPEKELQRAKADINSFKVKIREIFHRLDSMSAEGKFPDSLYDSEGLIDSEDIFCAKCGTKDLPAGNDIILCDGNCDRGFHQYCLEPPLRTEEIPPGDEGWFCPVCDCKFDCVDLLNDSQGAKLTIEDSWENVFPEAVAAMAGLKQDDLMGLPSDDSDDNDYNPGAQDDDFKDEEKKTSSGESGSDESDSSDFSSASEDLEAVCKPGKDDQYLGYPSDDSEDNDFDPDAASAKDDDECASASSHSDFTSTSEDLEATVGEDEALEIEGPSSPVELEQDLGESLPLSGKRYAERLDYKKLYDETYGNDGSDSSDDEEWTDGVVTTKNKTSVKKEVSASANGDVSASTSKRRGRPKRDHQVETASPVVVELQKGSEETTSSSKGRKRPKRDRQVETASPVVVVELQKGSEETTSSSKGRKRPPYNKLPEPVTQRLYESFKENKYPDRSTKEKLAEELGLTPLKVDKWFGNARWSLHHHPSRVEALARVVPGSSTPLTQHDGAESGKSDKLSSGSISTPKTRKRKDKEEKPQTSKIDTNKESEAQANTPKEDTPKGNTQTDPSETPETLGRGQRKRKKSGA